MVRGVSCDSGPATDIGFLMGKCMVPRYDMSESVDFFGGSIKKTLDVNVSISDVRYAMKSPFTCDQVRLGPSSR